MTIHKKLKAELFYPEDLHNLGFNESDRFSTRWNNDFDSAELYLDKDGGRLWQRRSAKANGPLVGKYRLRLKDPRFDPQPRFRPVTKLPAHIGRRGDIIHLRLSQPLLRATKSQTASIQYRRTLNPSNVASNNKANGGVPRRDLTATTKRRHIDIVHKRFGGLCPGCGVTRLTDEDGNKIAGEFDHFYSRERAALEDTWLICSANCHKPITFDKQRIWKWDEFTVYQKRARGLYTSHDKEAHGLTSHA